MGELGADELHVWTFALDAPAEVHRDAWWLLAEEERARLERIPSAAVRARWLVARAGARTLLGSYLEIDPPEVEILRGPDGRPELAPVHDLCFNLSHAAGMAIFAIGRGHAIGVDVEALDRRAPSHGLIQRALNSREASRVMRVAADERTGEFLAYWTVKEAYAKALGVGLALDLREVGVEGSTEWPRLDLPAGGGEWQVRRLWPRPGFVGAVVADGGPWRMRLGELRLSRAAMAATVASG